MSEPPTTKMAKSSDDATLLIGNFSMPFRLPNGSKLFKVREGLAERW